MRYRIIEAEAFDLLEGNVNEALDEHGEWKPLGRPFTQDYKNERKGYGETYWYQALVRDEEPLPF